MPVKSNAKGKVNKVTAQAEDEEAEEETEEEEESGPATSAKPRKPRSPSIPWTREHDLILAATMHKLKSSGKLTPETVVSLLAKHPKFVDFADRLSATAVTTHVRALIKRGQNFPELGAKKYDPEAFNRELAKILGGENEDEE